MDPASSDYNHAVEEEKKEEKRTTAVLPPCRVSGTLHECQVSMGGVPNYNG